MRRISLMAAVVAVLIATVLANVGGVGATGSLVELDGIDTTTRGDWATPGPDGSQQRHLGTFASVLPDSTGPHEHEVGGDRTVLPNYDEATGPGFGDGGYAGEQVDYRVHGPVERSDPQVLQLPPDGALRRPATCFGEQVVIHLPVDPGSYQLSVYVLDYDFAGRAQTVEVTSGTASASQAVGHSGDGVHLLFDVEVAAGDGITVTATRTGGPNAVVSGVFLSSHPGTTGVQSAGLDTTTRGDWMGVHGDLAHLLCGAQGVTSEAHPWDPSADVAAGFDGYTVSGHTWAWRGALPDEMVVGPAYSWAWNDWAPFATGDPCHATFWEFTQPTGGPVTPGDRRATAWDSGHLDPERPLIADLHLPVNSSSAHDGFLVSFLFLDVEGDRSQELVLRDETADEVVDQRVMDDFGCATYVQYRVPPSTDLTLTLQRLTGTNPVLSGIFVDELDAEPSAGAIDLETYVALGGGPTGDDLCPEHGKPAMLHLRYTGGGPAASSHQQDAGSVRVDGDPAGASPVRIVVTDTRSLTDRRTTVFFDGVVSLGDVLVADSTPFGKSGMGAKTFVHVLDAGTGAVLQVAEFHSSCSQPLHLGDRFGAVELAGFTAKSGTTVTAPPPARHDADDPTGPVGSPGDPVTWTYEVTNGGEAGLGSVAVVDDAGTPFDAGDDFAPAPVESAPGVNVGDTDGDGILDVGETWLYQATSTVTAGQYGASATATGVPVNDGGAAIGPEVSDVDRHHHLGTEVAVAPADLCEAGRPASLTLRYTGEGPSATSHSQDPSAVRVAGDPAGASPVRVVVLDRAPSHRHATVLADAVVTLGGQVVVAKDAAGLRHFPTNLHVTVSSPGGATLQQVSFHTSCSQPLHRGDQFGSIELAG